MGLFYHQKPNISTQKLWLQLSIWVLIVSWHDQYVDCAVLTAVSPPTFRFLIRPLVLKSLSKTPLISCNRCFYLTATQRISVGSQICKREVKERLELQNLCPDHAMIRSELKYVIGVKVAGTVEWNRGPGTTRPNNRGFMSGPGNNPAKTQWVGYLAGFGTEPNRTAGQKPDRWRVTRTRCLQYFQTLPDPPAAKESALRLCKGILRYSWRHLQLWRCIQDGSSRIVKFWSSWDLCADLRETSRDALDRCAALWDTSSAASQLCGRLDAVFSHQWFIHNHKAFRLIIFIFVTVTRFATLWYGRHYVSLSLYRHRVKLAADGTRA